MSDQNGSAGTAAHSVFTGSRLTSIVEVLLQSKARIRRAIAHPGVRNAGWIGVEKIGRMVLSLLVGIFVVRQLGPDRYGTYAYVLTWATIFSPLALFGIGENTVRHLVGSPVHEGRVLATAASLRAASSLVAALLTLCAFLSVGTHADANAGQLSIAMTSPIFRLTPRPASSRCAAWAPHSSPRASRSAVFWQRLR
jgi:hypothetical protein